MDFFTIFVFIRVLLPLFAFLVAFLFWIMFIKNRRASSSSMFLAFGINFTAIALSNAFVTLQVVGVLPEATVTVHTVQFALLSLAYLNTLIQMIRQIVAD